MTEAKEKVCCASCHSVESGVLFTNRPHQTFAVIICGTCLAEAQEKLVERIDAEILKKLEAPVEP